MYLEDIIGVDGQPRQITSNCLYALSIQLVKILGCIDSNLRYLQAHLYPTEYSSVTPPAYKCSSQCPSGFPGSQLATTTRRHH